MSENQEIAKAGTEAGIALNGHSLIGDYFTTLAPGCCPTLKSTCSWQQETLVWASAAVGMQFLSNGSCPHTLTAATGRFLTMQLFLLMIWLVTWLTQLPALETGLLRVCETPSVFMLCCVKSGTKCETEHVFGKCSEYLGILCHCCYTLSDYLPLPLAFESRAEPVSWLSMHPSSSPCGLADTWWRISLPFLNSTKNTT